MDDVARVSLRKGQYSKQGKDAALAAIAILPTERLAQNCLILRILNECLSKLKLSLILPNIFENPITVFQVLKGTEYEECGRLLLEYLRETKNDPDTTDVRGSFFDYKLIKLINHFQENYKMIGLLPTWFNRSVIPEHSIMESFDLLTHIVDQRMHRIASMEIQKEMEMHRFHRENIVLRREIDFLRRKVRIQRQQQRWKLALRAKEVGGVQEELAAKKWQHIGEIAQILEDNATRIKKRNHTQATKLNTLLAEADSAEEKFQKLLTANMKEFKNVRDEKNKALIQLQNTIEKYDRALGEKIKEDVYLQDEYDKVVREMDKFMVGYSVMERQYNAIVEEEVAEHRRQWQMRADFFFWTRAARIIQRYARKYLAQKRKEAKALKKSQTKRKAGKRK